MKLNLLKKYSLIGSVFGILIGFQNCAPSKYSFAESASTAAIGKTCVPSTTNISNQKVKVLFVLDNSGSNVNNNGRPGTDPEKVWRSGVLNKMIDKYSARSNFNYGLISFKNDSATSIVDARSGFSGDLSVVRQAVANFENIEDKGSTPYKKALSLAYQMISDDIKSNPNDKSAYSVIFTSDGQPSDYKDPIEVITDATAIMALAPGQIVINSVFYYIDASQKVDLRYLENIATTGNGAMITANSEESIDINDIIQVPSTVCQ